MYELVRLTENCCYIESPAKIGLFRFDNSDVCLIDSGNDKDAGRKIRQILDANNWKLKAIYNTHSNADHIGGNRYLQNQTNCRIFAPGIDDLRHKFLMAQESNAEVLTNEVLPEGFQILPLPGHFFDMVGFRTPDDVVFLADCLSSRETLEKYQISFIYDVASYLETLEKVKKLEARIFVPSHAAVTEEIASLAQVNIEKVLEIAEKILEICNEPQCFETILQKLFLGYSLVMNFEQYVLVGSTVRSYLSWLKDSGKVECIFENGLLLWHHCE